MKYLLFIILIPTYVFALENWQETCFDQGEIYGKQNFISPACQKQIIKHAIVRNYFNDYTLYGWKNIIIAKKNSNNKNYIVAGDKTLLNNIKAISYQNDPQSLLVLSDNQLLVYPFPRSGNIVPSKMIKSNELIGKSAIAFTQASNTIVALSPNKLTSWSLTKDSRVNQDIKPEINQTIELEFEIDKIAIYQDILILLNINNKKLYLYKNNGAEFEKLDELDGLPASFLETDFELIINPTTHKIQLLGKEQVIEIETE